ncbi:MAG: N-6 DNA methylase [Planctomycetes bacterium]|nr:N-6 DNA methylase [Planctomycetota bacterium]
MLKTYLQKISETAVRGDAREESYYPVLAELLRSYAESSGKKGIHITSLPKKTEAGNPDFRIWDGKAHITGYIEAKAPDCENLDKNENTPQLKRYLQTFPNMILTNFFEFRLYRDGNLIDKVLIGRTFIVRKLKTIPPVEKEHEFTALLDKFFSFSLPKSSTPKSLALELAKRTRFLKDEVVTRELIEEEDSGKKFLTGFYEAFNKYLITGLSKEEFADLYSQTVAYGLFAARTRSENGFNRKLAYDNIPHTIGILRDIFRFISLEELPPQMEWVIDDISEVLAMADVKSILHQYFHEGKGKDPVVHFYETFLSEYDSQLREKRGVYYTPEPVVSYIVESLHHVLKEQFQRADGLANKSVTVLDPAAGTLTFPAEAAKTAVEEFVSKYGEGGKPDFISEHILKDFYAFEIMMAPYAVGHLKISFLLEELGHKLRKDERFKLYLTNTLDMNELAQTVLPGMTSLSVESHLAGEIKKEKPILAILGNPPYSGMSANCSEYTIQITQEEKWVGKGKNKRKALVKYKKPRTKKLKTWIGALIENYKIIDGKPLNERNPKWLQDDYVKFMRFAQWKIDQAGEGVLGFITNHGYLDNPTFRGMRQSLMKSFNDIYIVNLHGNLRKKETAPDGSPDENVFDIQQGTAIAVFIKQKGVKKDCDVHYAEIWGRREDKYAYLSKNNIKTTKWQKLSPKKEQYLFIPRDEKLLGNYELYPKITEIFPVNSVGIVTSRDNFAIDFDKEALKQRIRMFCNQTVTDETMRQTFNLKDKYNWKLETAREKVRMDKKWEDSLTRILYRPFDMRWIFYHDSVTERTRKDVMQHMIKPNLGLVSVRQVAEGVFNHSFVTSSIIESRVTLSNKGIAYLFPLYLYAKRATSKKRSFRNLMLLFDSQTEYAAKQPNISKHIAAQLEKEYSSKLLPEQIFNYIYAILYSNIYRTRYAEFLKMDFPRIPFVQDPGLFYKMADLGGKLVDLHLQVSENSGKTLAKFQGKGDNRVVKVAYEKGKILINKEQYFENISPDIWQYQIGGYHVCDKWLKERKDRSLSLEDIKQYCGVITALAKTIEIQKQIDRIYQDMENRCILF